MIAWEAAPELPEALLNAIVTHCNLSPAVAKAIYHRIPVTAEMSTEAVLAYISQWLDYAYKCLTDPFAIGGMSEAIQRIEVALAQHEAILIYGDYDADGICATTILQTALKTLGATISHFIPNREKEGYGMTTAALERCLSEQMVVPSLIITVDCGITSVTQIETLCARGIDVIVTDHHVPATALPKCCAIVNPCIDAPKAASKLCGSGVAFMVILALQQRGYKIDARNYLDLAALATVGDVMELTGDNRILVKCGLKVMQNRTAGNRGLTALVKQQVKDLAFLTAEKLAFNIVPCINAASRMNQHEIACEVLMENAPKGVSELVELNLSRRKIEGEIAEKIVPEIADFHGPALVIGDVSFHPGVIGIVASRLVDRFQVPVAVVTCDAQGGGHGSIRAPEGYHVVEALKAVEDLLEQYGGHLQAAGFTLKSGAYDEFKRRFPAECKKDDSLIATPIYDSDLTGFPITLNLCQQLELLEPVGYGNARPIFRKTLIVCALTPIGKPDKKHLQLRLKEHCNDLCEIKAIWFSGAEAGKNLKIGDERLFYFSLEVDRFRAPVPAMRIIDMV